MKNKVFFAKNKAPKTVNNRRGRLIIRNLPFTVILILFIIGFPIFINVMCYTIMYISSGG